MSLMHMMEMEQLIRSYLKKPPVKGGKLQMDQDQIKMRYGFAMCAFARMYGVLSVNGSETMHRFCQKWARSNEQTPTGTLTEVNFYFKDRWDAWGGHV